MSQKVSKWQLYPTSKRCIFGWHNPLILTIDPNFHRYIQVSYNRRWNITHLWTPQTKPPSTKKMQVLRQDPKTKKPMGETIKPPFQIGPPAFVERKTHHRRMWSWISPPWNRNSSPKCRSPPPWNCKASGWVLGGGPWLKPVWVNFPWGKEGPKREWKTEG